MRRFFLKKKKKKSSLKYPEARKPLLKRKRLIPLYSYDHSLQHSQPVSPWRHSPFEHALSGPEDLGLVRCRSSGHLCYQVKDFPFSSFVVAFLPGI
jgi:hypothetical protein